MTQSSDGSNQIQGIQQHDLRKSWSLPTSSWVQVELCAMAMLCYLHPWSSCQSMIHLTTTPLRSDCHCQLSNSNSFGHARWLAHNGKHNNPRENNRFSQFDWFYIRAGWMRDRVESTLTNTWNFMGLNGLSCLWSSATMGLSLSEWNWITKWFREKYV